MSKGRLVAATVVAFGVVLGGTIIATADTPDPCEDMKSDRDYMACQFKLDKERDDKLDEKLDEVLEKLDKAPEPTPTPTESEEPSPTPTPSETQEPTPTPTPTETEEPEPTPTPTPSETEDPEPAAFPNADNTGPSGTLTTYTGSKTITVPTVIENKKITGTLIVKANLTIRNSELVGIIDNDYGKTVVVEDSLLDGGTSQQPVVGYDNITLRRTEVKGARVSVLCGSNCLIEDSWLHGQYLKPGTDWHVNGYLSNGGSNVVVRHNTIACDANDNSNGGGCTGPAATFGDFAPLDNITYENNLFVAGPGGYCLSAGWNESKPFGKNPTNVTVKNNTFQRGTNGKCGYWGPATSFKQGGGNVWSGNVWDNGGTVSQP